MLEQIISIAKDTFGDEGVTPDYRIKDAKGFDSMAQVQFVIELEEALSIKIDDSEITGSLTFRELNDMLQGKVSASA